MTRVLTDTDVEAAGMRVAVACMEDAFRQHAAGELVAPARLISDVEVGNMVFTAGASTGDDPVVGFRYYNLQHLYADQLVTVFGAADGVLRGIVIGPLLGAVRTGAIGGVAVKYLAREDTETLGILGTGYQAQTQLAATLVVRSFRTIRVFSRTPQRRQHFAEEMSRKLDCRIEAVTTARDAVEGADILLCTTTSAVPVVEASWLKAGVHINNVGPKFNSQHELAAEIYQQASRLATDAPAQMDATGEDFILHGTPQMEAIEPLSTVVAERASGSRHAAHRDTGISLFISLGLAGTEVLLAKRLLEL